MALPCMHGAPADTVTWSVSAVGGGSTGDFAPYLIGANSGGRHAMKSTVGIDAAVIKDYNLSRRFTWSAGTEIAAAHQGDATYELYESNLWTARPWHPGRAWVQQLWAGVKWRGVFAEIGMRDHTSPIVDDNLSSGDLTLSNNARAVPRAEIGFIDYQDIPFTRGWVQIAGSAAYGKYTDSDALKHRYNYYNDHITLGQLFTYRHVHFRTRTDRRLSVTIGVQAAGAYGGTTYFYDRGHVTLEQKNPQGIKAAWEMFIPGLGNSADGFVEGNHLGTWDLKARYRLNNGMSFEGYFQWLWEDGSGMGRRNMTDGLWGVSMTMPDGFGPLHKVVVEYIDFRDQSGPMHWAPGDAPGTDIVTEATGGDNYYNNSTFNAWANYGLGQGSSFPLAPLYNTDGFPEFLHNRTRGVHIAATGNISPAVTWTAKFSHGVAWGTGRIPDPRAMKNTSALATVDWDGSALVRGLSVSASVAFDAGSLRGDNFGALATVTYSGNFSFNR